MSWQKVWLVIRREYLYNFKRPSFLFTALGLPIISLGAMFLIGRVTASRETNLDDFQRVSYIDRAGIVSEAASNPEDYQPVSDPALEGPGSEADQAAQTAYYDALVEAANRQLVASEIDAYFVIADSYLFTGQIDIYARKGAPAVLQENIEDFMRAQIAHLAPDDLPVSQARLEQGPATVIRDLDTGEELSDAALVGRLLLPFIFVFVYFMVTNTTSQFLMGGVVEEKENRLMEILATSIRPLELLWGKLLGLGALSLTQVALWASAGLLIAAFYDDAQDFISGANFQVTDIVLFVGLFLVNFFLFSSTMLGIGAAVTAEAESRQIAGIFTFIAVLPMALLVTFMANPDGVLPMIFTFFPFTAAVALILRMGLTSLPWWQIGLSVAIQVVSVFVVMWLSAKVFRLGMLMYGKRLTPRVFWQALREGRVVMTTASTEYEMAARPQKKKKGWLR